MGGVEDGFSGVGGGVAVYGFEERKERGVIGVDGRNYGEVVLVFIEVVFGGGDGVVKGVHERWVVGTEGELGDLVGEIEAWGFDISVAIPSVLNGRGVDILE